MFNTEKDFQKLDYILLKESSVTLFHKKDLLDRAVKWLIENGYEIITFDCSKWQNIENFYKDFSEKLDFPKDYPAHNLDSLNDWMYDIEFNGSGKVLAFQNFELMLKGEFLKVAMHLLDILEKQSRENLLLGKRLLTLLQSNDAGVNIFDFGGTFAKWNRDEWLYKNRNITDKDIKNFEYRRNM